jgi:hypothetical protein
MATAMKRGLVIVLMALAAVPAASGAQRRAAGYPIWQFVSGGRLGGQQLGLARVNGLLYIASSQGRPATITVTRLDANGNFSDPSTVTTGFDGTGGLALLGMPDGSLRLFAAGGRTFGLGSHDSGVNSYVSPAGGASWSLDPGALWGGAVASAADELSATIAGNGWIVTTWSGAIVHFNLSPSDGDPTYQQGCCGAEPEVVTDGATGAVVLAWISNGQLEGTVVRQILPSEAAQVRLPSGLSAGSFGLSARIGAPGAYVAYADPKRKEVRLYEYAGGIKTLASGAFQVAKVFAAPHGRLWAMWGSADAGVYVTRSNRAVTRFEPIQQLPLSVNGLYNAQGEGSAGWLDLFADLLQPNGSRGFWHARVKPEGTLTFRKRIRLLSPTLKRPAMHLSFTVADAGDPIPNAEVTLRRGGIPAGSLHTDSHGQAEIDVWLPKYDAWVAKGLSVTATAPGYSIVVPSRGG